MSSSKPVCAGASGPVLAHHASRGAHVQKVRMDVVSLHVHGMHVHGMVGAPWLDLLLRK